MSIRAFRLPLFLALTLSLGCTVPEPSEGPSDASQTSVGPTPTEPGPPRPPQIEKRGDYSPYAERDYPTQAYWGDTHLHTANSGDAFGYGNRLNPEEAYRFAKGGQVTASMGQPIRLARPLDFLVVADHAGGLGAGAEIAAGNPLLMSDPTLKRWNELMNGGAEAGFQAASEMIKAQASGRLPAPLSDPKIAGPLMRSVWQKYTETAERYNEPGRFTALIGYEWTAQPGGNNLHRVVIFRDAKDKADQIIPFSVFDSEDPEKLWGFLESYEKKTGGRVLAIPHNGNLSNGLMFALVDFQKRPLTADYARRRSRWEPLIEVTQTKGSGETHPTLSPEDEFAGLDVVGWDNGNLTLQELETAEMYPFEYARPALKNGLRLEAGLGVNPFKFGMVGSTDSHTSLAATEEDNAFLKHPLVEPSPERWKHLIKQENGVTRVGWQYLSGGLAAVWAKENSREALWDAMERKEVYGTTGSRIQVRFFGGWDFQPEDAAGRYPAEAGYRKGIPMGGDMSNAPSGATASFLVAASKDPLSGNLDRIQIVKGWLDTDGALHERVYDVVWGDAERRKPDAGGKLTAVGNTVDKQAATWSDTVGDPELSGVWSDPDFDPAERSFYYARVLEIPTPRWTAYDAKRFGVSMPDEVPMTTIERAYTSPIWYTP